MRHHQRNDKGYELKRILLLGIVIFSVLGNVAVGAQSTHNSLSSDISGKVLINVYEEYGKKGFIEYTLSLPDDVLKESNRGKVGSVIEHPVRLPMLSSGSFAKAYRTERLYWDSMRDKLEANFSQGNMEYFDHLLKTLDSKKEGSFQAIYPSTGSIDKIRFNRSHLKYLKPNRQFTYIIFSSEDSLESKSLLIDVLRKEVSFPFGDDLFYEYDWDRLGQRVAYSSSKKWPDAHSILVVKDVFKNATLFRLDLNKKSIVDIAWDPSSQYIAVLSAIFSYSYNPLALLFTIFGHPVGYRTYYLELYDITGTPIHQSKDKDIDTFSAGRGSGLGAMVWVDKEDKDVSHVFH